MSANLNETDSIFPTGVPTEAPTSNSTIITSDNVNVDNGGIILGVAIAGGVILCGFIGFVIYSVIRYKSNIAKSYGDNADYDAIAGGVTAAATAAGSALELVINENVDTARRAEGSPFGGVDSTWSE